jgi:hypothetical protein
MNRATVNATLGLLTAVGAVVGWAALAVTALYLAYLTGLIPVQP